MKKVLVIDDEPDVLETIASRLEIEGFQAIVACDGQDGFEKYMLEKPDLIVLDIKMPHMDGYNFLIAKKEVTARRGVVSDSPVLVLTATVTTQETDMIKSEDIADYIVKPFKSEDLIQKIKKILEDSDGRKNIGS